MCLAFESPVFNANPFVSDSKPQYKSTALPSRWMQCFNVSWNAAYFYTPFNRFNATAVMGMQHSKWEFFSGATEVATHLFTRLNSHSIELCLTPQTCLNICLKTFSDGILNQ